MSHLVGLILFCCCFHFRSKLELISNAAAMAKVSHKQSHAVFEKDYYVLVMDNLGKVKHCF